MSNFPALKTGVLSQYPVQRTIRFSTDIVQFVDGSEQRFRNFEAPLREWTLSYDLLDEPELQSLRDFFRTLGGSAGNFAFTDPWDPAQHPDCSIAQDEMLEERIEEAHGKTALAIRENRA